MTALVSGELEVVDLSNFEFDRICMPWTGSCERTAVWLAIKKCCGLELPFCEPHKRQALDEIKGYMMATAMHGEPVMCYACNDLREWSGTNVWWERLK